MVAGHGAGPRRGADPAPPSVTLHRSTGTHRAAREACAGCHVHEQRSSVVRATTRITTALAAAGALALAAGAPAAAADHERPEATPRGAVKEAKALLRSRAATVTARASRRERHTDEQNVFLPSTLALRGLETPGEANATLPAFRGVGPNGRADVWYIVTEAADFEVARTLGVNYAPRLVFGRDTAGSQEVAIRRGRLRFRGAVDFAPERRLVGGEGGGALGAFPPSLAEPGAVADDAWSSLVVLPSGSVLNVQVVANATGEHDRLIRLDRRRGEATLQLLDGWQGGERFYYHLVTDSSDPVAATIELAVYAPRLANLPAFGESSAADRSALLGFSPNANGETGADNPERQGLNSTIVDDDRDPVNVFPLDPDNDKRFANGYSPMWDAHVSQWTERAIADGERRAIRGFADLRDLVDRGLVTSFQGSAGPENGFVAGLRTTEIIINCPVIAQPFERGGDDDDASPFRP